MIGKTISHYKILEKLGEGGMGVVYKAEDTKLERTVALKFLSPHTLGSDQEKTRFIREAKAAARLDHPNICTLYETYEVEGETFIAMAYCDGQSLDKKITAGPLNVDHAVDVAIQIAEGLREAHKRGVVHRDIKSVNIMVTDEGQVKIMDFGLAKLIGRTKLTDTATIMGTVDYMSPEQARGEPVDHRTDIWSLGIVLYEMLTGKLPFRRDSVNAAIYSILTEEPKQITYWCPYLPAVLGQAVGKMLQKEPLKRYENMASLVTDLKAIRSDPTAPLVSEGRGATILAERTPFVGREREMAELRSFLDRAKSGYGGLVMVRGEPGIGKTRLCEEFVTRARQHGLLSLTGHCYQMEGSLPYIPFMEIIESASQLVAPDALLTALGESAPEIAKMLPALRRLFPEIPPPAELPPEQELRHMYNSMVDFLARASRARPYLLILEDLQWADVSTLQLLQHLVRQLNEMPILIIGTYRDSDLEHSSPLSTTLEELIRQRSVTEFALKRLSNSGVRAMLSGRTGQEPPDVIVGRILMETDGNPFFVEEMFKHMIERGKLFDAEGCWRADLEIEELDVPRSIRLIITHRLERVGEKCRRALTAAAVIGHGFTFELLNELMDLDEAALLDAIDTAESAQLISSKAEGAEVRFTFFHELIRQTLVTNLSALRRQRLHLRVANAIERLYANRIEEHIVELAYHFQQAGASADMQKTIHYLRTAADNAYSVGAAAEAIQLYGEALSFQMADKVQAEIRYRRGLAFCCLGRFDEALDEWRAALSLYDEIDEPEVVGNLCSEISRRLLWASRLEEAYEISSRGLAALGDRINAARCVLLAASGHVLAYVPAVGYELPHDMFAEALKMAEKLGEKELEGPILYRKAMLHRNYWQGPEEVDSALKSAELLRAANKPFDTANALLAAEWGLIGVGRLDEAAVVERELEAFAPKTGAELNRCVPDLYECLREVIVTGNLDIFERRLSAALQDSLSLQWGWISLDYACLGWAQFWRGSWEIAESNFRKAVEMMDPKAEGFIGYFIAPLLLFSAYSGRRNEALEIMEEKRHLLPSPGKANTLGAWTMLEAAIEGLAMLEEYDEVAALYPLAQEAVATGNLVRPSCAGLVQTMAGIAAAAGEQWHLAEDHFDTSLKQAHELPHIIEQAEVRRWHARMLIERGTPDDLDRAVTLLTEATAIYSEINMPKHLGMAQSLVENAGRMKDAQPG